jgi:hypothetical protein
VIIRRLSIVAFVLVGLVAGATTGASAATVSPSTWAPKFCTAVIEYQTTLSTDGDALSTSLDTVTDLASGRDQIASYLADMASAAKTAKTEVKEAGVPSSPNGAKIVALFTGGLDASAKVFSNAQSEAKKLPTTSPTAFKTKGKQLSQSLSDAADELGKRFGDFPKLDKGKKLRTAVEAAPECSELT